MASTTQSPSHFDADEFLGALNAPTITVGGRTYTGRFLGIEDWLQFAPRLDKLAAGTLSPLEMRAIIRDLTNAIFPPPPAWRVWTWGAPFAYAGLKRLPLAIQLKALEHFTRSQATALNPATLDELRARSEAPPALGVTATPEAATLDELVAALGPDDPTIHPSAGSSSA